MPTIRFEVVDELALVGEADVCSQLCQEQVAAFL
jgi:hypothetical protein